MFLQILTHSFNKKNKNQSSVAVQHLSLSALHEMQYKLFNVIHGYNIVAGLCNQYTFIIKFNSKQALH